MDEQRDAFEAINAHMLRFLPELVAELGGEAPDSNDASPSYRQTIALIEDAAHRLACPDFGMRLALRQRGVDLFGPLGDAMRNAPTFGAAIDYVCSHNYAHSLAASVWLRRFPSVRHVFVGHDILLDGVPNRAQAMEHILLVGHLFAMELTGGRARARRVHFRHQPISPARIYRRYFGCPVHFGQNEDGISFSERDMASPVIDRDAAVFAAVTAHIEREFPHRHPPLHAQVRGIVMQWLWTAHCSNDRVAAELGLHPRTLHRRLATEGTSFQKIKDEVRRDILRYYLEQTDMDFAHVSEKLGFSEQSVMTRSCNHWFGASPTRLRARLHAPA